MNKIGLIISRYKSSRFPGKPLELIKGIPMFVHVYHRAKLSNLDEVYLCTDDKRIYDTAQEFKIDVFMTSQITKMGLKDVMKLVNFLI